MSRSSRSLLVRSPRTQDEVLAHVEPESAGWEHLAFEARRLPAGGQWSWNTGPYELGLIVLGGTCAIASNRGEWPKLGARRDVFDGLPHALYLPRGSELTVTALSPCEIAYGWCAAARDFPARLIAPADVAVEIRGGDNVSRQINSVIPPGFACDRLVMVEV